MKTAFWNNKGGTGKTSLAFQIICDFAHQNPKKKIWQSTFAHRLTSLNCFLAVLREEAAGTC